MQLILVLLAIAWIIAGLLLVVMTESVRKVMRKILKGKNLKRWSLFPVILGAIFVWKSSSVSVPWVAVLLGLLALAKGLFFLLSPENKGKAFIDWWMNASQKFLRGWGVVSFLLGALVLLIL